jgi:hypothetical protein
MKQLKKKYLNRIAEIEEREDFTNVQYREAFNHFTNGKKKLRMKKGLTENKIIAAIYKTTGKFFDGDFMHKILSEIEIKFFNEELENVNKKIAKDEEAENLRNRATPEEIKPILNLFFIPDIANIINGLAEEVEEKPEGKDGDCYRDVFVNVNELKKGDISYFKQHSWTNTQFVKITRETKTRYYYDLIKPYHTENKHHEGTQMDYSELRHYADNDKFCRKATGFISKKNEYQKLANGITMWKEEKLHLID